MDVLFRSPLGALLARPWIDRPALFGLARWYFPLSRLWAAANASAGDVDRFRDEIGAPLRGAWPRPYLGNLLARHGARMAAAAAARATWEDALFEPGAGDGAGDGDGGERRVQLDRQRRGAATRHLSGRAALYPLLFPTRPPPAHWRIESPAAAERALADVIAHPDRLYAATLDPGTVEVSAPLARNGVREVWVRGPSPAARLHARPGSERFYARIVEPAGGDAHGTLVFGSGLGLELELLTLGHDPGARLATLGWRVLEPISPYHGLRAMPGFYGGEPFVALAPTAPIDLVAGQAVETALLVAWLRARYGGRVAVAGISMTSFVAQQVASRSHLWPAESRPDAVMLISHSGSIGEVTFGGALAVSLGLDRALARAGWSRESLARLAPLVDPTERPSVPPARIVSVLGVTDRWLPHDDGMAVARGWRLPEENVFRYTLGHLGMPVQLMRDPAPFERLRRVMAEA